jgi:hypothetical protein
VLRFADGREGHFPEGTLIKYREWYGWNGKVNEGCKMPADKVGMGVRAFDLEDERAGTPVLYGLCDPSMYKEDGGPSIATTMASVGCPWIRADNSRIPGWEQIQMRLQTDIPMLFFLDCCTHTIRTLPELQYDETNAEDLDTEGEDHAADETRYACASRPLVRHEGKLVADFTPPKTVERMTFMDLVKLNRRKRLSKGSALL